MSNHIIYNAITGKVSMFIQTDDFAFVQLNTAQGHNSILSSVSSMNEIDKVDIETNEVILKDLTPNLGNINKSPLT